MSHIKLPVFGISAPIRRFFFLTSFRDTMRHMKHRRRSEQPKTSWQDVEQWYTSAVGSSGHYYHQHVVLPGVLRLLALKNNSSLLDLGCGQGVLGRHIDASVEYVGIDPAPSLIRYAKEHDRTPKHQYVVGDATKALPIKKTDFTHAAIVLALQNVEFPERALATAAHHLRDRGALVVVINHPCFRIPRQSGWGIDEKQDLQYRRMNMYLSPMKIPISAHPGKGQRSPVTWSFHVPLSSLSASLAKAGFVVETLEEWISDKQSEGAAAKRENRSRKEFPLFLAIKARKASFSS